MNKIFFGAAALAILALMSKKGTDKDDNAPVTAAQKENRVITFFKA
ncbi:MAG: hypothetical protein K9I70_01740 [Chitinophagaceae bacterium]|jgi:hypothetical protein|nr:hypothetical protein [Chitinophagaceae bacterium]